MNFCSRKEHIESETIYQIIQNKKSLRNKILDNNGTNTMKSLKNKTVFNYFITNSKKSQKNNRIKAKSLKVIHQENNYFKTQHSTDKKTNNFFNKNNLRHSVQMKNSKRNSNYTFFTFYDDVKNSRNEMNDILNQLIKIKQKINGINMLKNKKLKNIGIFQKSNIEGIQDMAKSNDKTKQTKYNLKVLNKNDNFESTNEYENKQINYKTEINNFSIKKIKNEVTKNNDLSSRKKQKFKLRLSLDKINQERNSEKSETTNSSKKDFSKSIDKSIISYNYNNYNNIRPEKSGQINYIDKLRNDEFINLYNKFKKSMKKIKKEEITHRKSLVFPAETVDYIIKKKNEFILDKFRNEYLKIFDNYKFNKNKILKVIKNCKQSELKNIENCELNTNKNNIEKICKDNNKENEKNNDTISNDVNEFYF